MTLPSLLRRACLVARNATPRRHESAYTTRCLRRYLCTSYFDPSVRSFAEELKTKQPAFGVLPKQIRILHEPADFYQLLLDMIGRAQRRIFISSLYVGSTEHELIFSIKRALQKKPKLKVYLQLDLNRSTRPGPSSTANLLLPLLREFPDRLRVSMFRSPSLHGILAKIVPPRFNEGWGTWHAKIYGIDNEVVISGANLNQSYFTNRQDRYLHFKDEPSLAQYCFDFLKTAATFSYNLLPYTGDSPLTSLSPYSYTREDYLLSWPDPDTHPHQIQEKVRHVLSTLQQSYITNPNAGLSLSDLATPSQAILERDQAVIFPLIQAGQFGIREEERTFELLFKHLRSLVSTRPLLDLTSGYFSLYKPYQDLILKSPNVDCRIVAASPKANGFYGSQGISGRIPEGYTLYEQRFMRAVKRASRLWKKKTPGSKRGRGVKLSEWLKPGWTYHAKGIWLSPDSSPLPVLTLFGSTNFNARSAELDTELSFLMIVPSESAGTLSEPQLSSADEQLEPTSESPRSLRQLLSQEVAHIRANTVNWKGDERNVRFTTKVIVRLVKGML